MLITCQAMLLPEHLRELENMFWVRYAPCALNGRRLMEEMDGLDYAVAGGEEQYTAAVIEQANPGFKAFFLGVQANAAFTPEAIDLLGPERLFVTGGGEKQVAKTAYEFITNPVIRRLLLTQKSRDFRWTSVDELIDDAREARELDISVIGAGNIGRRLLEVLDGKCRSLKYHNPRGEKKDVTSDTIRWEPDIDDAFVADIVSIHLALTPDTRYAIRAQQLEMINLGGWLVNFARAEIVDPVALMVFLSDDGKAVFDPFYVEGDRFEALARDGLYARMIRDPRLICTSHTAAFSNETRREYGENLIRLIREKNLA